jgi:O-antigen/teichoic acid export membrane protein
MANNGNILKEFFKRFKDLTSIGVANICAMLISSLFWLYMATLIGEEGYGNIGYLLATAGVVGSVSMLGAADTLVVFRAKDIKLQSTIFLIVIIVAIIASLITFLLIESKEISIYILGYVIFSLILYESLGSKQYKRYSMYFISQRILSVGLAISFYFLMGLEGIILGYALSFFPFSIYMFKIFKNTPIKFELVKSRSNFIVNSYARSLMQAFSGSLDKVIILPLFGAALLGNYYLGFQIFNILAILPGIVFQYILPQESSGSSHAKLKKITIAVSGIFSIIAIVSAPIILPIFFPDFTEAIIIVQIMSLALIPSTIGLMYVSKLLGNEKIKIVIIGQIIGLVVTISGIYGLGEIYGIMGAAMAYTIGTLVGGVYYFVSARTLKIDVM